MKKVFLGLSIFVSTLLCEELSQYEAVQKLNDVSGRLIVEQQSIKNDLAIIKSKLGLNGKLKPIPSVDEFQEFKNKLEEVTSKLARIEEKLNYSDSQIKVENIVSKDMSVRNYVVATETLNVRQDASMNARVVDKYKIGKEISGFDLNNGWIQIKNLNYFLSKSFVVEKSNIPLTVVKNSFIKSSPKFDERNNIKLVKKGEELKATAKVMNGNWFILQDGSFINSNVTKIK